MIRSKKCFKCEKILPHSEFYKHSKMGDGLLGKCKDCTKSDVRRHREENLERIRAYDRARGNLQHRVEARKAYQKTEAYKASHAKSLAKWASTNKTVPIVSPVAGPKKKIANTAVGNAVRDKRLIPWPVCSLPECNAKPEAHHPDYDRPLDVVWLCKKHHHQAHKLFRTLEREKLNGPTDHT